MSKKKRTKKAHQRSSPASRITFGWCRPPELRALLDTLREGFERRRDKVGLRYLEKLFQRVEAVGMESELTLKWVERRAREREEKNERERKRFEHGGKGEALARLMDPDRMAERAVQTMLWTDIQRAVPAASGAPAWERFEIRGEDGKPVRLLPRGSDEVRRWALKAYMLKEGLRNYFQSLPPLDRAAFLVNLFQTPPPASLIIDLRGKLKHKRMPPLHERKAEYADVRQRARALWSRLKDADFEQPETRQDVVSVFPELDGSQDIMSLPPLRSASFAHLVLSKRWGVTPSTVKTGLKR